MNNVRRKEIINIIKEIDKIKDKLDEIKNDEEFAFDNMPENLQGSLKGEASEYDIELMDNALDNLSEAISNLEEVD